MSQLSLTAAVVVLVATTACHCQLERRLTIPKDFGGIKPVHYDILLSLPSGDREYSGEVGMTFESVKDGKTSVAVEADHKSLSISEATIVPKDGSQDEAPVTSIDQAGERATFGLPSPTAKGESYVLKMKFTGPPKGSKKSYATLFQQTYAKTVFPCVDQLAFKATFSLCLVHNAEAVAVGNTEKTSSKDTAEGKKKTCFAKTGLLPTEVVAFGVLNGFQSDSIAFETALGKSLTSSFYVPPGHPPSTFSSLKAWMPRMVNAVEEYFDMPFPVDKIDVHVYGRETKVLGWQVQGAIENDGLIGFPQRVDEKTVLHEVIHHYAGNLVSISNWRHLNLQEGITEYLNSKIGVELGCKGCLKPPAAEIIASYAAKPYMAFQVELYTKPNHVFHMFEDAFGADVLKNALRQMFKDHARGLITWDIFEDYLKDSSCEDCAQFFHVWRASRGFPVVHVSRESKTKYSVSQSASKHGGNRKKVPFPLNFKFRVVGGDKVTKYSTEFPFDVDVEPSQLVLVNPDSDQFQLTLYDAAIYKDIVNAIKDGSIDKDGNDKQWVKYMISDFNTGLKAGYLKPPSDFEEIKEELNALI